MLALIYEYILSVGRLNYGGLDLFGFPTQHLISFNTGSPHRKSSVSADLQQSEAVTHYLVDKPFLVWYLIKLRRLFTMFAVTPADGAI